MPFHKKIAEGFRLRRTRTIPPNWSEQPIWIHASSGEFEYAKPVVRECKKLYPKIPVLVTYSSPSYAKQIESFPGVDYSMPLPLDLPGPTDNFIKKVKPRMLLIARTDFWPEVLTQTKRHHIPALVFACTFRPLHGLRSLLKPYYKMLFDNVSDIYAVASFDTNNVKESGTVTHVQTAGDTRYDQVLYRLQNPKPLREDIFKTVTEPIVIAGSSWPQDEQALLNASQELLQSHKIKLVLVPHEPTAEHLKYLEQEITKRNLTFTFYSTANDFSSQILIVDQIGLLAELYLKAHVAVVGGSFRKKVHSVMEPLAAGLLTIVGPHHKNNREAVEFQHERYPSNPHLTAVTAVHNSQELKTELQRKIALPHPNYQDWVRSCVQKRTGTSQLVTQWIKNHINTTYQQPYSPSLTEGKSP